MNWHLELDWFKFRITKYFGDKYPVWNFTLLKISWYNGGDKFKYLDLLSIRNTPMDFDQRGRFELYHKKEIYTTAGKEEEY